MKKNSKPLTDITILDLMDSPAFFARWFRGPSWTPWRTFLKAVFALPMSEQDMMIYKAATGRQSPPSSPVRRTDVCVGRRGGKSQIASLCAVYLSFFRDYEPYLAPGEVATVLVDAADRRQAHVIFRYVRGFISAIPALASMVTRETREIIELSNRVVVEVRTASSRTGGRGFSLAGICNDEIAYWPVSEDSAEPDKEIIGAQVPAMATIPGALMLNISSPYAKRGVLWESFEKHWGRDAAPVLYWKAPSRRLPECGSVEIEMNSSLPLEIVQEAFAADPDDCAASYFAEFRLDISSLFARPTIEAAVIPGRFELPASDELFYVAFADPSGGSSDSFTVAVGHVDTNGKAILDCLREQRPPFSPDATVEEFSALLKSYRISQIIGDKYGGEWPPSRFAAHGIEYVASELTKSEIYLASLPLLNSGKVELLDHPRLVMQLVALERRTSRGGRDSIDHPPNAHDDLSNAACGVLTLAPVEAPEPYIEVVRGNYTGSALGGFMERGWQKLN